MGGGLVKVEISMPKPTRKRMIGTGTFATTLTSLFLAPGLLGWPGADLSPKLVFVGIAVPFGVGAWSLAWAERRVWKDQVPLRDELPQKVFEKAPASETVQIIQVVPR
jgi:hypothetical protein